MKKFLFILLIPFLFVSSAFSEDEFLDESVKFSENYDEIYLENPMSFKYETGLREIKKISGREEVLKNKEKDPNTIYKNKNLSVESVYEKSKSYYLTNSLDNEQSLKYNKGGVTLKAGISNYYETTDLAKASRKIFLAPEFRLNKHITLGLNNSVNIEGNTFEQGIKIKYLPYFLKNSSFALGGKVREYTNSKYSAKFELNSEFYLW